MSSKVISIPMVFAVNKFANDIAIARRDLELTGGMVERFITVDKSALYRYEQGKEENMKMANFLSICNLYDLDPRAYFVLRA